MSAPSLEIAVPTTAPTGVAPEGSPGAPTGTDTQAGQDFAALVARALGLARAARPTEPVAEDTAPETDSTTTAPGAPGTEPAVASGTVTDSSVLTDQSVRDAVVAALGLAPVVVPTTTPAPGASPIRGSGPGTPGSPGSLRVSLPGSLGGPAATTTPVDARAPAVSTHPAAPLAGQASTGAPAAVAQPTPAQVDATTDQATSPTATPSTTTTSTSPTSTSMAPLNTAAPAATTSTAPAAPETQAVATTGAPSDVHTGPGPDAAPSPVATAAAALAAATGGATQHGQQGGTSRDGKGRQDAAATAAPATTAATAATAATETVQVVASGPVVVTGTVQATPGRVHGGHHVVTQVIPEIARLVSDGQGVHRVTLQLNPRALGDVRVVLTMRQGDVHVRLVAGDDARAALAQSSSELTRALDQLGLKDHRISLSDVSDPTSTTWTSDQTNDSRQHTHSGGFDADPQHQNSQHSWMGDDSTATDGMNPSTSGRTHRSGPVPPFGRAPAGALDVRM